MSTVFIQHGGLIAAVFMAWHARRLRDILADVLCFRMCESRVDYPVIGLMWLYYVYAAAAAWEAIWWIAKHLIA